MKFVRRSDLAPQTRIEIVKLVWQSQGIYGKMTEIAQQYQISRTFLYPLLWRANWQVATLFSNAKPWVFYLSDEIFALDQPILVTIDAHSTTILNIELAADRSAETWRAHFATLEQHHFVSLGMASDRGTGLVAGYQEACDLALWVADYFHEVRGLYEVLHQLERKAYAAIAKEYEAARTFANAKSEANLQKRLAHYDT